MGPYRTMRHPIYTGMLLGTALVVGEVRGLLALVIVWQGPQGRSFLSREFGAGFEAHAKHAGMFLRRV